MIQRIPAGTHEPLRFPRLLFGREHTRTVMFYPSCKYDIGLPDQLDWNKLFGVGFFPGIHKNSYRFGWRYNPDLYRFEIAAYWYEDGVRKSEMLGQVRVLTPFEITISYHAGLVTFSLKGQSSISVKAKWSWIGLRLDFYFGGNQVAPHDMKILIQ
jgi:hypothetical protein